MARQLFIGETGNNNVAYTNGKLADGALEIEVLHSSDDEGPILYDQVPPGNTDNPDMFRIVQGTTTGPNVYSNWIRPSNVFVYDGTATAAAQASFCEINSSAASVVAAGANGDLELKFVYHNGVVEEFWHLNVDLSAGADATGAAAGDNDFVVKTAYDAATKPDWLWNKCIITGGSTGTDSPHANNGGAVASAASRVRFYSSVPGDGTGTQSGKVWTGDVPKISVIVVSQNDITTATWTAPTAVAADATTGWNGSGTGDQVTEMEKAHRGILYGYYNRRSLPNTPDLATVDPGYSSTEAYDMISFVASKDGSSASGQIHGVDNLDEIIIAGKSTGAAWNDVANNNAFVQKMNALLSHLPPLNNL